MNIMPVWRKDIFSASKQVFSRWRKVISKNGNIWWKGGKEGSLTLPGCHGRNQLKGKDSYLSSSDSNSGSDMRRKKTLTMQGIFKRVQEKGHTIMSTIGWEKNLKNVVCDLLPMLVWTPNAEFKLPVSEANGLCLVFKISIWKSLPEVELRFHWWLKIACYQSGFNLIIQRNQYRLVQPMEYRMLFYTKGFPVFLISKMNLRLYTIWKTGTYWTYLNFGRLYLKTGYFMRFT